MCDFKSEREEANKIWNERSEMFSKSQKQWLNGDKSGAKTSSEKALELEKIAKALDAEAALRIFGEMNKNLNENEIDLHGLYAEEARRFLQIRLESLRTSGVYRSLLVIHGKGEHSKDHKTHIEPVVLDFLKGEGYLVREGYDSLRNKVNEGTCSVTLEPLVDPSSLKIKLPPEKHRPLKGFPPSEVIDSPQTNCCTIM